MSLNNPFFYVFPYQTDKVNRVRNLQAPQSLLKSRNCSKSYLLVTFILSISKFEIAKLIFKFNFKLDEMALFQPPTTHPEKVFLRLKPKLKLT